MDDTEVFNKKDLFWFLKVVVCLRIGCLEDDDDDDDAIVVDDSVTSSEDSGADGRVKESVGNGKHCKITSVASNAKQVLTRWIIHPGIIMN